LGLHNKVETEGKVKKMITNIGLSPWVSPHRRNELPVEKKENGPAIRTTKRNQRKNGRLRGGRGKEGRVGGTQSRGTKYLVQPAEEKKWTDGNGKGKGINLEESRLVLIGEIQKGGVEMGGTN